MGAADLIPGLAQLISGHRPREPHMHNGERRGPCECDKAQPGNPWSVHLAWIIVNSEFARPHSERTPTAMSNVLWCDAGNHPYKAGAKGSQSFDGTAVNADGIRESYHMDICPEHAFRPGQTAIGQAPDPLVREDA